MGFRLIIASNPYVASAVCKALGVRNKYDGYLMNQQWIVTYLSDGLYQLKEPDISKEKHAVYFPEKKPLFVSEDEPKTKQYKEVIKLLGRAEIEEITFVGPANPLDYFLFNQINERVSKKGVTKTAAILQYLEEEHIKKMISQRKPLTVFSNKGIEKEERLYAEFIESINNKRLYKYVTGKNLFQLEEAVPVTKISLSILSMVALKRKAQIGCFPEESMFKISGYGILADLENIYRIPCHMAVKILLRLYEKGLITYPFSNPSEIFQEKELLENVIMALAMQPGYESAVRQINLTDELFSNIRKESKRYECLIIPLGGNSSTCSTVEAVVYKHIKESFLEIFPGIHMKDAKDTIYIEERQFLRESDAIYQLSVAKGIIGENEITGIGYLADNVRIMEQLIKSGFIMLKPTCELEITPEGKELLDWAKEYLSNAVDSTYCLSWESGFCKLRSGALKQEDFEQVLKASTEKWFAQVGLIKERKERNKKN